PDAVEAIHLDYLEAGAECITTASYQVSQEGFAEVGLSDADAEAAIRASIRAADRARARHVAATGTSAFIAASLGPYGAVLHDGSEYHGRYAISFDGLVEFHASRLVHMRDAAVDLIACETIPSLEEARAVVQALARFPELRAWLTFTCADEHHTAHGESI